MKKNKLNLRNKIVRASTYTVMGLAIANFYGWFGAEILEKLFM